MADKQRNKAEPSAVIAPFEKRGEYYVDSLGELRPKPLYSFLKRIFDVAVSALALLVLCIPMVIIAVIVGETSEGSSFYYQELLGKDGKPFKIIKFRTMWVNAEESGAQWSSGYEDKRITPVGLFLRKYRLDELPQLWCILKGEMSFVGPRPERACFYDMFETYVHGFRERLKVKPGLTGLAQINGYYFRPEEKIQYDVVYIKSRSLWVDIKILIKTVAVVIRGAKSLFIWDAPITGWTCHRSALLLPAAPALIEGVAA